MWRYLGPVAVRAEVSLWRGVHTHPRQCSLSQLPDPAAADVSVVATTGRSDMSFLELEEAVADVVEFLLGEEWIVADAALGPGHGVEMLIL